MISIEGHEIVKEFFMFTVDDLEETKSQIEEVSRKRKAEDEHKEAPQAKRQMIEIGVYKRKLEHLAVKFKK